MIGQGIYNKDVSEQTSKKITELYRAVFGVEDLKEIEVPLFLKALQPDSLLERFAYRKRDNADNQKRFSRIQGTGGQLSHESKVNADEANPDYGFKCLHYSVTESAGAVEITIIRKRLISDDIIGVMTVDGSAKAGKDYR